MSAIGPGDFVECVSYRGVSATTGAPITFGGHLTVGAIYRIERFRRREEYAAPVPYDGVYLFGFTALSARGFRESFSVTCFRPIYRPDASLIEGLLKPIDEPADA